MTMKPSLNFSSASFLQKKRSQQKSNLNISTLSMEDDEDEEEEDRLLNLILSH